MFLFAGPRCLVRGALRVVTGTVQAVESLPRIAAALEDVRATLHHIERLAAYIAQEVPELVYQLEQLREEDDVSRESPRTG
ncbi:hypothetical protein H4696_001293 [Amycolatopsis lexingtonensis]|uniref:Uncharacterized protein n=1 Tax=Amycolatopsis lexingtonensis TaxID=218822 RepID=A0ABR9HTD5_9PSEU|nr:hypothetical protein [Amycolatopsis lexingtonensis]MBE1494193.1 hypothetical protein [Amycolatopsis lexingtonensis]